MRTLLNRLFQAALLSLAFAAVSAPTPAHAGLLSDLLGGGSSGSSGSGSSGSGSSAPEIDPGALAGTLALAAGGVAILAARRRRA